MKSLLLQALAMLLLPLAVVIGAAALILGVTGDDDVETESEHPRFPPC